MISKNFGLYQIKFQLPRPSLEGAVLEFDTIEEVEEYINNPIPRPWSEAWVILKKEIGTNNYKFHECRKLLV